VAKVGILVVANRVPGTLEEAMKVLEQLLEEYREERCEARVLGIDLRTGEVLPPCCCEFTVNAVVFAQSAETASTAVVEGRLVELGSDRFGTVYFAAV